MYYASNKDRFYDFVKQYDTDPEHHLVGEVDYYLLSDDQPYAGPDSHKEALRVVFERLGECSAEKKEEVREMWGDEIADQLHPWVYDLMDDPETILLIDSWRDQEALDIHHASSMMATIAALRDKYDLHMEVERFLSDDAQTDDSFIRK